MLHSSAGFSGCASGGLSILWRMTSPTEDPKGSPAGERHESRKWPSRAEAQAAGCSCEWIRGAAIARFDPACPVLGSHRGVPEDLPESGLSPWGGRQTGGVPSVIGPARKPRAAVILAPELVADVRVDDGGVSFTLDRDGARMLAAVVRSAVDALEVAERALGNAGPS